MKDNLSKEEAQKKIKIEIKIIQQTKHRIIEHLANYKNISVSQASRDYKKIIREELGIQI